MSHGEHFVERCTHGAFVSQCRCASPNKAVRIVACPPTCTVRREAELPWLNAPVEPANAPETSEAAG